MTEVAKARRKSTGSMSWLWMLVAILTVSGFMVWLGMSSEPAAVAVVDESLGSAAEELEIEAGQRIALDRAAAKPELYIGHEITLAEIPVSSRLGESAFWASASNGSPFLVKLSDELVADGKAVSEGQVVTVRGQVLAVDAEVLDSWASAGLLSSEGDRQVAEYATAYLEAAELETHRRSSGRK